VSVHRCTTRSVRTCPSWTLVSLVVEISTRAKKKTKAFTRRRTNHFSRPHISSTLYQQCSTSFRQNKRIIGIRHICLHVLIMTLCMLRPPVFKFFTTCVHTAHVITLSSRVIFYFIAVLRTVYYCGVSGRM